MSDYSRQFVAKQAERVTKTNPRTYRRSDRMIYNDSGLVEHHVLYSSDEVDDEEETVQKPVTSGVTRKNAISLSPACVVLALGAVTAAVIVAYRCYKCKIHKAA